MLTVGRNMDGELVIRNLGNDTAIKLEDGLQEWEL